ncbi:unnamed protein product [Cuscuta campestris]|uniref:F-box domain-containing protein n=1 Tax=Cuscuta campestris TaxID=132261 RepID=A0A484KC77_9ASTE|nr:unnamed protein product [Cuscuta campestris]
MLMASSDEEDESLAQFLESEVLAFSDQDEGVEEEEEERAFKKMRFAKDEDEIEGMEKYKLEEEHKKVAKRIIVEEAGQVESVLSSPLSSGSLEMNNTYNKERKSSASRCNALWALRWMETGVFCKIPPECLHHILKFLSSEDLIACSLSCKFLNYAASDESLWRRLYCMRWGLLPPNRPRECAWKLMYIQRDTDDMAEFVKHCPSEFKQYYIQMQAAKRSQAPLLSQVNDDHIILDKTVADQISIWKKNKGFSDEVFSDHACSGETCTYYQINDVFVCENTGHVHVCDDACKEVVLDPTNELLVCTISGHCFDRMLSPSEIEADAELQQASGIDEAEPFMGSGRFARAYSLGYNCDDEKELEAALRFC